MHRYFEPTIIEEIRTARSKISISFDGWGSKREKISLVGVVAHFIDSKGRGVSRLLGMPELPGHGKAGKGTYFASKNSSAVLMYPDQAQVILPLFNRFNITSDNLGFFVLDNARNNDTTLVELSKTLGFEPKERRLRCMGHIINLIAEQYLFGQDSKSFEDDYKEKGEKDRRRMWRTRGALGKLHNLVSHVIASGKRTELFTKLQDELNTGVAGGKRWKLLLDGGVRWNASYIMIRRAFELRPALNAYSANLSVSSDELDSETFIEDYLADDDWADLELIKDHLEKLFYLTKNLEGNADLQESGKRASHGALWETTIVFEALLSHFEKLEDRAKYGEFNGNPRIQSSITLAWGKAKEFYVKTDLSIAWVASVVLHPRFKWQYFETHWTQSDARYITPAKTKLKRYWEQNYKGSSTASNRARSKTPDPQEKSYLETMLDSMAPANSSSRNRTFARRDQLTEYLAEPLNDTIGPLEYWQMKQFVWPELAAMAFDLLAIPAMSSECERVFSSCAKMTTPESGRLKGTTLWSHQCLKNWQRRGAIDITKYNNAMELDLNSDTEN